MFTCGHGLGGRLGHGDEQTYLVGYLLDVNDNMMIILEVKMSVKSSLNLGGSPVHHFHFQSCVLLAFRVNVWVRFRRRFKNEK